MFTRTMLSLSLLSAVAVAACSAPPPAGDSADVSESVPAELKTPSRCDGTDIFVQYGLYDDLKAGVDPKFSPSYTVDVPGALRAFASYGGDMVTTVPGAGASAERVFDVNPGGAFHGEVGGSPDATDAASLKRFRAAKALYEAMTRSVETSKTEQGVTWTYRTTPGRRAQCEKYTYGSRSSYSCRFSDLLFVRGASTTGAVDFCPSR